MYFSKVDVWMLLVIVEGWNGNLDRPTVAVTMAVPVVEGGMTRDNVQ